MTDTRTKRDLYQEVTNRIVAELERGCVPWVQPWANSGTSADIPINGYSNHPYRGINIFLLWLTQCARGYESPEWFTYRQAQQAGGRVRRGESATLVVLWKQTEVKDEQADALERTKTVPLLRHYSVFNRDQIDALPTKHVSDPTHWDPLERAERVVRKTGAVYAHTGGDRACYSPALDSIRLPKRARFSDRGAYYATLLHEVVHWSGHSTRLNRAYGQRFGDTAYAREELVAEMGSAFLCAWLRIPGRAQHPEYVQHWLGVLRADKRAVFTAASHAQKAADFILDGTPAERKASAS